MSPELTLRDQHFGLPSPPEHPFHLLDLTLPFNKSLLQKPLSGPALLCTLLLERSFLTISPIPPRDPMWL